MLRKSMPERRRVWRLSGAGLLVVASLVLVLVGLAGQGAAAGVAGQTTTQDSGDAAPTLGDMVNFATSPAVRDMPLAEPDKTIRAPEHDKVSWPWRPPVHDAAVQSILPEAPFAIPTPAVNVEGINETETFYGVPDTTGDVGPNHFVQFVNAHFAVFNKSGVRVSGAGVIAGNQLFANLPATDICRNVNRGDPLVAYDPLADRWVMSQFAFNLAGGDVSPPFHQCIAVSSSPDPLGTWHAYSFNMGAVTNPTNMFNDYGKIGVWPDGYYMTFPLFNGDSFSGSGLAAFDRARMLAGQAAPNFVFFQRPNPEGIILPADLDGSTPPAAGAPAPFAGLPGTGSTVNVYRMAINWANPAASTLSGNTLAVAAYTNLCPGFDECIPQPGTTRRLDPISGRPMQRLAYRNFGTHQAMVFNHTVSVGGIGGVRWYEIRNPTGIPTLFQQGTFTLPDGVHRWMGAIAMDRQGNMALGYSASSSTVFPSIRYTGRLAGDPAGQMPQGEAVLKAGTTSQTDTFRWGDYSQLTVDPVDDCTFWITNEYLEAPSTTTWRTRIGSFKFAGCGAPASTSTPTTVPASTSTPTVTGTPPTAVPTATPCPMSFSDAPAGFLFYESIRYLYCMGAISGYADGTFRPFNNATRGQMAKIIVVGEAFPIVTPAAGQTFTDVPRGDAFFSFVETAAARGIVSGYSDGSFRPYADVTRGQLSKIIVVAEGWPLLNPASPTFVDVPTTNAFYREIETAFSRGIISGYDLPGGLREFRWYNNATRGQISKIVHLAISQ